MIKPKIGDWGYVTGNHRIVQAYYDRSFPQGWYGRVIAIDKFGRLILRCYRQGGHPHLTTMVKYFKQHI